MSTSEVQAPAAAVVSPKAAAPTPVKEQPATITPTVVPPTTTSDDKAVTTTESPQQQVTVPSKATELVGSSGEKVVIGDNYIHITYNSKKDSKNNDAANDDNLVLDGEASATLAEATSEIAAAASDVSSPTPATTSTGTSSNSDAKLNDEDKSSLATLTKLAEGVNQRIMTMERSIKKLADHIISLISLSWNTPSHSLFGSFGVFDMLGDLTHKYSLSTSARAAKLISDKMESEAKSTRDWLAAQLQQAQPFSTSTNDIIKAKYDEVKKKVDSASQTCEKLIGRANRAAAAFTHFLEHRASKPSPAAIEAASKQQQDKKEETKEVSETKRTETNAAAPTAEKPIEKRRVRWSPDFLSRELLDGVLITSTLPGLTADNLTINVDDQKRILHISGQRTVKQRVIDHEATAAQAGQSDDEDDIADLFDLGFSLFGGRHRRHRAGRLVPQQQTITKVVEVEQWFDEKLQLPVWLDTNTEKYRTSIDPQTGHFSIAIPKVEKAGDTKRQAVPVTTRVKPQKKSQAQEESKEEKTMAASPTATAAPTVAESVAPAPSTTTAAAPSSSPKAAAASSTGSPSSKKRTETSKGDEQKSRRRRVSPSPDVWAYVDDASNLFDAFQPFQPRHVYHRVATPPPRSYMPHPFLQNVSPFTSFPFAW